MITVLLSILKIIGIILLCVILLILAVLLLVLFVPIRYQIEGYRKEGDEVPVRAGIKITWLLHILNASFQYPEQAFLKARVLCFTVFSSKKDDEGSAGGKPEKQKKKRETEASEDNQAGKAEKSEEVKTEEKKSEVKENTEEYRQKLMDTADTTDTAPPSEEDDAEKGPRIRLFLKKLFSVLKNIKYTIRQIYDKIKHIVKNIRYYIKIIKSDPFQRAWKICGGKILLLVKSILPKKISADFTVGTGDPAGTAQILSIQGILYPLIGECVRITPDFDHSVIEGSFYVKGRITVFRILITAIKVYFNKDLRKVIRMFKKEAA